jgi:hypothetical protein
LRARGKKKQEVTVAGTTNSRADGRPLTSPAKCSKKAPIRSTPFVATTSKLTDDATKEEDTKKAELFGVGFERRQRFVSLAVD